MLNILLLLIMLQAQSSTNNSTTPLVIAHRGVPYFAPEETTPSYLLAKELGADYLEADLQRTKDGVLIALHDNDLRRTTNIREVFPDRSKEPVSTFTWAELQQLDAGSWFNKRFPDRARKSFEGLKILSLNQLIDIAESGNEVTGIYLETKLPELFPEIEKDLKELLKKREWLDKKLPNGRSAVYLQTFSPGSLEILNSLFPNTPKCWLMWKGEACLSEADEKHFRACLSFAKSNGAEIIGPSFNGEANNYFNLLEPWMVEMAKKEDFEIHPYTFVTSGDIKQYAKIVNGMFTDRTDLVLKYYGRNEITIEQAFKAIDY